MNLARTFDRMVKYLKDRGYWVRGVDIKEPEYEPTAADEFLFKYTEVGTKLGYI